VIVYRRTPALRLERFPAPQPPFWTATAAFPYGSPGGASVEVDFRSLSAVRGAKGEVSVCDDPVDQIERVSRVGVPITIDASSAGEPVFRRGEALLTHAAARRWEALGILSSRGHIPPIDPSAPLSLAISAWPLDRDALTNLFADASASGLAWGVIVPVIFPLTTALGTLEWLAGAAAASGARYLAAVPLDLEPEARRAIVEIDAASDETSFDLLFHSDLELLSVATERHIAALAAERALVDRIVLPGENELTNWNAAVALARTADRLIRMKKRVELGWEMIRASGAVAQLGKPIDVVAGQAGVSAISGVDGVIAESLEEWLDERSSELSREVDAEWRLRRDYTPDIEIPEE
jgi:hypothetical protein